MIAWFLRIKLFSLIYIIVLDLQLHYRGLEALALQQKPEDMEEFKDSTGIFLLCLLFASLFT